MCEAQGIKRHLPKLQNFLFFSIPDILNESSLVNQEVRVKNNKTSRIIGSRTTSQLSLLSVVSGSDAVSHFPFSLLPLSPRILTQEDYFYSQTSGKIQGWTAIIKEGNKGKIFQKQKGTRTMVSTANGNVKSQSCVIRTKSAYEGLPVRGIKKMCSVYTWSSPSWLKRWSRK